MSTPSSAPPFNVEGVDPDEERPAVDPYRQKEPVSYKSSAYYYWKSLAGSPEPAAPYRRRAYYGALSGILNARQLSREIRADRDPKKK
jgi:hypothetical protein